MESFISRNLENNLIFLWNYLKVFLIYIIYKNSSNLVHVSLLSHLLRVSLSNSSILWFELLESSHFSSFLTLSPSFQPLLLSLPNQSLPHLNRNLNKPFLHVSILSLSISSSFSAFASLTKFVISIITMSSSICCLLVPIPFSLSFLTKQTSHYELLASIINHGCIHGV